MSRPVSFLLAAVLVVLHGLLAFMFAKETPYRTAGMVNGQMAQDIGAPDERQHANYVMRLAQGESFPTFDPKDPNLYENYQAHQPPLFYLTASTWAKATGATNVESADAGQKLRLLNVGIGSLGVLGVFFLGLWGFKKPEVAVTAVAIAALLPMNVALSGAISNDPLLITLCTWSLALFAKGVKSGRGWELVLGSVLVGLAALTKTTAVALMPILLFALFAAKGKMNWGFVFGCLALAVAIPSWWWVRNTQLYGDPFALKAFNEAFTGSAQRTLFTEQIIPRANPGGNYEMIYWTEWVGWWTARSFIGVFGYMDVWLTDTGYPTGYSGLYMVMLALLVVGALGWLASFADKDNKESGLVQAMNATFAILIVLLFVRFNMTYFQAQARYLYPAIGPIAVGVAVGWTTIVKQRPAVPAGLIAALLLGANAFALGKLPGEFAKRTQMTALGTSERGR